MSLEMEYYKYKNKFYEVEVIDEFVVGYRIIKKLPKNEKEDVINDKQWFNIMSNYQDYLQWQKKENKRSLKK